MFILTSCEHISEWNYAILITPNKADVWLKSGTASIAPARINRERFA